MELIQVASAIAVKRKPGRPQGSKSKIHKEPEPNCTCKYCGKRFYVPPSWKNHKHNKSERQFCCREHYFNYCLVRAGANYSKHEIVVATVGGV